MEPGAKVLLKYLVLLELWLHELAFHCVLHLIQMTLFMGCKDKESGLAMLCLFLSSTLICSWTSPGFVTVTCRGLLPAGGGVLFF